MSSYLGAFPFPSQAPAILTYEALLKVVTILTERYGAVIKKRKREIWLREIYRSMAVHDRGIRQVAGDAGNEKEKDAQTSVGGSSLGFAVDAPEDGGEEDEEDDELVLAALDSMDAVEVFKHGEHSDVHHSIIPTDNFLKLVELLLLIAPIDAQQSLSQFAGELTEERIEDIRKTASVIIASFGVSTTQPGITYRTFNTVISTSLPYLFNGLNPLFSHFLFAKDLDLSKRKPSSSSSPTEKHTTLPPPKPAPELEPVLDDPGEILTLTTLSHLSFFLKGNDLFRRLHPLYSGTTHGFSMGAFEKQVFTWRAPTILLVSGHLLPSSPTTPRARAFTDSLPPSRHPSSLAPDADPESTPLTLGAYMPSQWKHTPKTCLADPGTLLFQLSPVHDVFPASRYASDHISFTRPPSHPAGLALGTPVAPHSAAHVSSTSLRPGPVSLHLDDALEFAVFTHLASGGGSFAPSVLPGRRGRSWQDRIAIDSVEVWGCGGDDEAEAQQREWAFEAREAEARRRINFGTGDVEADRELLRMAGLVGRGQEGGSMG